MKRINSSTQTHDGAIGVCFTPEKWCRWLIERYGILQKWLEGATVCDPTSGNGAFILALCEMAQEAGVDLNLELLGRVALIEREKSYLQQFKESFSARFDIEFPVSQLYCQDIVTQIVTKKFDCLIGNPPWVNFADLPTEYKEELKPFFIREGLVKNDRSVLLGGSRVDLAALVLNIVLGRLLKPNGEGVFFIPLSLFYGDSAHDGFRHFKTCGRDFCVRELCEFDSSLSVFPSIETHYGVAHFQMDTLQEFPVNVCEIRKKGERHFMARPAFSDAFSSWTCENKKPFRFSFPLEERHRPRQGVNSCGCNDVFIFDEYPSFLEDDLLFPLAVAENFKKEKNAKRWILVPHDKKSGKPLEWKAIPPKTQAYLLGFKERLQARRGIMIRSQIMRGFWWALLGVGSYSFAPYKVIWEAYGKKRFNPKVFKSYKRHSWQGNQALHAYIPCQCLKEANALKIALYKSNMTAVLRQMNAEGNCNWAQPGKVWRIISMMNTLPNN